MKFFRRIAISAASIIAVGLIWGIVGWWPLPSTLGNIAARVDVSHGRYRELGYGLPFLGSTEYAQLLDKRYGIEFQYVGFCTVSRSLMDYADAYNNVNMTAAKQKFGSDIFRRTHDEALTLANTKSDSSPSK
jgi:hypothetical protein